MRDFGSFPKKKHIVSFRYDIDDDDEEGGDGAYRCSTEVRRRDGRPAKLARMHGLGQPRLTMYPHSCLESPLVE